MKKQKNTSPDMLQSNIKNIVFMDSITSNECYYTDNKEIRPVLHNICISILKGQVYAITGTSSFEIRLLAEIIANIRSYDTGKCVLLERGMMRRKRIILPHIFYIGNPNMAYSNMNVLEFLMFSLMKSPENKIKLQEDLLEYLIRIGLENIALTPISTLPNEYKVVILLLVSAYSHSQLIVFNFPEYTFEKNLVNAIANITALITQKGKTLLLTTQDSNVIEKACSHMAFLMDSELVFQGSVDDFRCTYDKIVLTMWDKKASQIARFLRVFMPEYEYDIHGDELTIRSEKPADSKAVYKRISSINLVPEKVELNPKTVRNAWEEILKQSHDIH